ncbi:MAG TPA: hypothetical protein VHY10_04550 [Xanthobacteraceae bacterium]|nr:hypothetical protein [Xanthobacteraceae bacterium]
MSGTAYALFMGGLAAMFVIIKLTSFDAGDWISRDLKHGDLYSLIEVASGQRPDGLTPDQASRLEARGMVRRSGHGRFRATLKGRLALRIRQAVRRTA